MLHYSMTLEIQFIVKMNLMQMVRNTIHPNYICHSTNIKHLRYARYYWC